MKKIGLVVALEEEFRHIIKEFGGKKGEISFGNIKIMELEFNNTQLFLAETGVGEISASMATMCLILDCKVDAIINFGVVGSLKANYKAGDTVIVNEIVHYDFTASLSDPDSWGKYLFKRDSFVHEIDANTIALIRKTLGEKVRLVRIATGDKFINVSEMKNWLVSHFDCCICDMESMGIYLACHNAGIPLIMVKSVSDNADESADMDFKEVVKLGVSYYIDAVKKIVSTLSEL